MVFASRLLATLEEAECAGRFGRHGSDRLPEGRRSAVLHLRAGFPTDQEGVVKRISMALMVALLALLVPAAASATSWHQRDDFQIKFHFGKDYFGKQVTGVYAHVGIQKHDDQCGKKGVPYWDSSTVQHVKLKAKGDHYYGAIVIRTGTGECQPRILGPMVQYWVYVKGGGTKAQITKDVSVPTSTVRLPSGGGDAAIDQSNAKFLKSTKDATKTEANRLSYGWAS
jgi:hypothetical protein